MSRSRHSLSASRSILILLLAIPLAACSDQTPTAVGPEALAFAQGGPHVKYVSPSGTDTGDCSASACRTINYAVGQASAGDQVSVGTGTYQEAVIVTKQLTLEGHNATIDATGQSSPPNGVVISGAATAGTVLRGFTIENAGLEGVFVVQTSRVTIEDNVVMNNDAYGPFNPLCVDQPDDCGESIHLQGVTNSVVRGNQVHDNIGGILLTDEDGPTAGNLIADNNVFNNTLDCGITLASHHFSLSGPADPQVAGVYRNTVLHNTSNNNGAAGIGVFAGPPGAAAWGNTVIGNTASNNGFAGIMIHSHTPLQYVDGNVITNNTLSGNGIDDDNPVDDAPTAISVFSAVIPIPHTVISSNRISDEHYGIVTLNAVKLSGLESNHYASSVPVPTAIH